MADELDNFSDARNDILADGKVARYLRPIDSACSLFARATGAIDPFR